MAGARGQVHEALGDDVAHLRDVDLRRYSPKTLIREHLLGDDDEPAAADPTGVSGRVSWAARPDAGPD